MYTQSHPDSDLYFHSDTNLDTVPDSPLTLTLTIKSSLTITLVLTLPHILTLILTLTVTPKLTLIITFTLTLILSLNDPLHDIKCGSTLTLT